MIKKLKHRWKWRKAKQSEYPYVYVGPTFSINGARLEYGTPLRLFGGKKGVRGGARYVAPDDIIRVLANKNVELR